MLGAHIPGVSTDRGQLGGSEPGWIRPGAGQGSAPPALSLQSLLVWLAPASACTRCPVSPAFVVIPPPFHPQFFSLYWHQCPQGVGHEICADWRDPEGNFSASR